MKGHKVQDRLTQGGTYCRPDRKKIGRVAKTSKKWCPVCGYKIRSNEHTSGQHHGKKHPSIREGK